MTGKATRVEFSPSAELCGSTELRHLPAKERRHLAALLDASDGWKELAAILPRPDGQEGFLLSAANIRILEQQKQIPGGSSTQALLDYWGTMGRKRPTLDTLIECLTKIKMFRVADFVAVNLLGRPSTGNESSDHHLEPVCNKSFKDSTETIDGTVKHITQVEPSAPSPSLDNGNDSLTERLNEVILENSSLEQYSFAQLASTTNNFSEIPVKDGGCKLGEGAFGSVFKASLPNGKIVAIKLLKSDFGQQFVNEANVMGKFRHENLLPLLGISSGGPNLCLIFEYMPNGSLFDALAKSRHESHSDLNYLKRLDIAIGSARGLAHLHTFLDSPFVHRDVKSDNILLDQSHVPKLGDFGLARTGSAGSGMTTSRALTQNVIGTTVYMAPEAFRGDVSVKLDSFSFGVVLLELLTGLKPFDERRDETDLLSHVEEFVEESQCEDEVGIAIELADKSAGEWQSDIALGLFTIAKLATEQRKKNRLTIVELLPLLEKLKAN